MFKIFVVELQLAVVDVISDVDFEDEDEGNVDFEDDDEGNVDFGIELLGIS